MRESGRLKSPAQFRGNACGKHKVYSGQEVRGRSSKLRLVSLVAEIDDTCLLLV